LKDAKINFRGPWGYSNPQGEGQNRVHGALCNVLDVLDKQNININVLDAISFSGHFGSYVWVDPKDVKAAAKALKV
jgi:hypothetical protein